MSMKVWKCCPLCTCLHLTIYWFAYFIKAVSKLTSVSLIDSSHLSHPIAIKKSKFCTSKHENTFNDGSTIRSAIVRRPQGVWLPLEPVSHGPTMNSSRPGQWQWGVKCGYGRPSLVNFTVSFVFCNSIMVALSRQMTSSRYATGRVCQVVPGDSVKCTKMASVHEKTVAQGSVVVHAKWSLTQVLLYNFAQRHL